MMFIRSVQTKTGSTQIQVVQKVGRVNRVIKHFGTARSPLEVSQLREQAQTYMDEKRIASGTISLFDSRYDSSALDSLLSRVRFPHVWDTVTHGFLSHCYDTIGFSCVVDTCFADLVVARIIEPTSKRRTRDMLEMRLGKYYSLTSIYRCMKTAIQKNYQSQIEQAVYAFVTRQTGAAIGVLFFDVTTLYYEAFDEDDLRRCGFSKEHKHNQPQLVVALTVTTSGIPLDLHVFPGNTFEGHTMLPCIEEILEKYTLPQKDLVIVADAAMLSDDNIQALDKRNLKYIVGARLGNLSKGVFDQVVQTPKTEGACKRIILTNGRILLVGYSAKRAAKDKHDREKQMRKATQALEKPDSLSRKYKFVQTKDSGTYELNDRLITKAEQLEGLKGYVTNAGHLSDTDIIGKYMNLWQVEKSFRMSKSDLQARPIFHTTKESIEAHLLIVFTALVVSRYVEMTTNKSIKHIVTTLNQVKEIIVEDRTSKQRTSTYSNITPEIKSLFDAICMPWVT
jgi:hypothetical protein